MFPDIKNYPKQEFQKNLPLKEHKEAQKRMRSSSACRHILKLQVDIGDMGQLF